MNEPSDRSFLETLATSLEPYLSGEAKKASRALQGILALFPGQTLSEIEKSIKGLLASSQNDVVAIAQRARDFVDGKSSEPIDTLVKAVGKLSSPDLKKLGKALDLELNGTKPAMVEAFRVWVESRGEKRPATAKDKMKQKAKEYADGLPERMAHMDHQTADDIIAKAEKASKDKALGNDGFQEFAQLLGVTVRGTKANMLTQFKNAINQIAVSRAQTQF